MLKQKFIFQFGSNSIIHIIGMIAGIFVARFAGPNVVGTIAFATSYVGVFGFINGLFGSAHIKLAAEGQNHEECMAIISWFSIITGLIYVLATTGWFLFQKFIMNYPFESRDVQIIIFITLLANLIHKYEGYATTVFTANLKQAKANIPTVVRSLIYHLGRIVIVLLGFKALAISSWNLLLTIAIVPLIYRMLREYPIGKFNPVLAKRYLGYATPMLIIVVVNSITGYADKLFLAHYTDTTQLGYYSAAKSIGGMFMLIAGPVGSIFFPLFSGMIAKGNWNAVNMNIRRYQEFIVLFLFPLLCALAIAGGPALLLVLGQRYQPSVQPFMVLLFATYFVLWGMPYGNVISALGKFNLFAMINIIKLVIFVVSITVFLSPKYLNLGATGVALNLLVLNMTGNLLYLMLAKRFGDIHIDFTNHVRHLIIIVISIAAYYLAAVLKVKLELWWLIMIPIHLAVVYGVLIICKLIKKEHWLLVLDSINLKKTSAYVNGELKGK